MKPLRSASILLDPTSRLCLCSLFIAASLICSVYFIGSVFVAKENKERLVRWGVVHSMQSAISTTCKNQCRLPGTEALPQGIISKTSNLEMHPLWMSSSKLNNPESPKNLLAIAVGIKQKKIVDRIVKKFPAKDFIVMPFHYDGIVDEWKDLEWNDRVIHVSAVNQTKWNHWLILNCCFSRFDGSSLCLWGISKFHSALSCNRWFAKHFLHPDVTSEDDCVFLWDEDIGVEDFNPNR